MLTKIMEWVSVTALLLMVSWRFPASYQLPLDSVVCAGTVLVVLSWFYSSLAKSSLTRATMRNPTAGEKPCKALRVAILCATVNPSESPMAGRRELANKEDLCTFYFGSS